APVGTAAPRDVRDLDHGRTRACRNELPSRFDRVVLAGLVGDPELAPLDAGAGSPSAELPHGARAVDADAQGRALQRVVPCPEQLVDPLEKNNPGVDVLAVLSGAKPRERTRTGDRFQLRQTSLQLFPGRLVHTRARAATYTVQRSGIRCPDHSPRSDAP